MGWEKIKLIKLLVHNNTRSMVHDQAYNFNEYDTSCMNFVFAAKLITDLMFSSQVEPKILLKTKELRGRSPS